VTYARMTRVHGQHRLHTATEQQLYNNTRNTQHATRNTGFGL